MMKLKINIDDEETRALWDTALAAKAEVESWPTWKHNEIPGPTSSRALQPVKVGDRVIVTAPGRDAGVGSGIVVSTHESSVYVSVRVVDGSALLCCNSSDVEDGDWRAEPDPTAVVPRYLVLKCREYLGDAPTLDEARRLILSHTKGHWPKPDVFRVIDRWDPDDSADA